ncbi:MAG: hypothetical protein KatS3mg012_0438 [Gaiellaceae bacterium]|nr:MAG: hypothetical protein KatS3mg012_0438 [Gaiellaceae bacterium]
MLGAALAYRLFIWLLPLALVVVLGLGIVARQLDESMMDIVRRAGLTGSIAASIGESSEKATGWGAVLGLAGALLVLSWALPPHAAEHWRELVPGAALFGVGVAFIGLFNGLVLFPWLAEQEATYGVLGVAAGLLFGFFLIGRTVELAAALNAELAESRRRTLAR